MKSFLAAIQFLTIVPVRLREQPDMGRAAIFFPLIGTLLGLAGAGLMRLPAPRPLAGLLVLAFWIIATGGLHEDGLADCADAFGGGRTKEDVLRIMKDSRIGTFGALALILSVAVRWQTIVLLPQERVLPAMVVSQALPRAGMALLAWMAGPASQGLGGAFAGAVRGWHAVAAVALGLAITLPLCWPAAGCLLLVPVLALYFRRRIGGVTGDCLGAANQLQEMAALLLSCFA